VVTAHHDPACAAAPALAVVVTFQTRAPSLLSNCAAPLRAPPDMAYLPFTPAAAAPHTQITGQGTLLTMGAGPMPAFCTLHAAGSASRAKSVAGGCAEPAETAALSYSHDMGRCSMLVRSSLLRVIAQKLSVAAGETNFQSSYP